MLVAHEVEVRAPAGSAGDPVVARVGLARRFDGAGRGAWRTDGSDWPLYVLDEAGAQSARVVTPPPGSSDDAAVVSELRFPILLTPAGDGSGELVGRASWKYAW